MIYNPAYTYKFQLKTTKAIEEKFANFLITLSFVGVYKTVQIGEKQVDYNPSFQLFLLTRNDSPDIPPDAADILSLINFTTTSAGLTGQLLATILHHEKPELEQRKSQLLKVEEDHKIQISKLEDFLLEQLASSQVLRTKRTILKPFWYQT